MEGYIPGLEVAVEGLITDGVLRILAIFDKPDPLEGPYFEETIYVTPSRLSGPRQFAIQKCAEEAARAVGFTQGPVHAEFRVSDQSKNVLSDQGMAGDLVSDADVWPLEIAARPIGGLCARSLRFVPGGAAKKKQAECTGRIGLEELILHHALNLPDRDWVRESLASAVMMIPVPKSGLLERVEGEEAARAVPGITELLITARLFDYIEAWPEGSSYLGFLFASAENPEEAERALRKAHAKLQFTLTPRLPVQHPLNGAKEQPAKNE